MATHSLGFNTRDRERENTQSKEDVMMWGFVGKPRMTRVNVTKTTHARPFGPGVARARQPFQHNRPHKRETAGQECKSFLLSILRRESKPFIFYSREWTMSRRFDTERVGGMRMRNRFHCGSNEKKTRPRFVRVLLHLWFCGRDWNDRIWSLCTPVEFTTNDS